LVATIAAKQVNCFVIVGILIHLCRRIPLWLSFNLIDLILDAKRDGANFLLLTILDGRNKNNETYAE
jgi:hypothetical protein